MSPKYKPIFRHGDLLVVRRDATNLRTELRGTDVVVRGWLHGDFYEVTTVVGSRLLVLRESEMQKDVEVT